HGTDLEADFSFAAQRLALAGNGGGNAGEVALGGGEQILALAGALVGLKPTGLMGWMAPSRHLCAKVGLSTTPTTGAIHERGYNDRAGSGQGSVSGAWGRCGRGGDAASRGAAEAGSGILRQTAALSGRDG